MGASPDAPSNSEAKSPTKSNVASPSRSDAGADAKPSDQPLKTEDPANEPTKPLAPPPKPGQQQGNGTPDFFSGEGGGGSLSLEPNPFEQSFGGGGNNSGATAGGGGGQPETPGGTKLPSVAALTSPSSLLPGAGTTPFNWPGGSLRTGPLSPAMLSGPTNDYFGDTHHIRGGFPTPNESSLRTGLTPGGSGSMFPAPSPNTALLAQLAGSSATPGTLEFHRTALSAAAKRELQNSMQNQGQPPTSSAPEVSNGTTAPTTKAETKPSSGPFDPHDNDAANGLYMLAQGRNGDQSTNQFATTTQPPAALSTSPQMASINGGSIGSNSVRGVSEISGVSDESEQPKPTTRSRGRKNANNGATTNGRRKAEDSGTGRTSKKSKSSSGAAVATNGADMHSDNEDRNREDGGGGSKSKMTDEEKRKNFLERNRVAALKCRQRKKQWLQNLQSKVEMYSAENESLTTQIAQLREEVVNLKTLLLAHKDCPVTQQQAQAMQQGGIGPIMQVVEPFNQMNPYGMATSMANGPVMGAQPVRRRFS